MNFINASVIFQIIGNEKILQEVLFLLILYNTFELLCLIKVFGSD